jgi:hypothetical protein
MQYIMSEVASESLNGSGVEAYVKGGYKARCDLPYICLGFGQEALFMGFLCIVVNAHYLRFTLL